MAWWKLASFAAGLGMLPLACVGGTECSGPFGLCVSPPSAGFGGGGDSAGGAAGNELDVAGHTGSAGKAQGGKGTGGNGTKGSGGSGASGGRAENGGASQSGTPGDMGGAGKDAAPGGSGDGGESAAPGGMGGGGEGPGSAGTAGNAGADACGGLCPVSYACVRGICMQLSCGPDALFCEDFETGHADLFTVLSGKWSVTTASVDGPSYEGESEGLSIAWGTGGLRDVRITVGYRLVAGTTGGGGIVARYQGPSTYYGVIFSANGNALLVPPQSGSGCGLAPMSGFDVGDFSTFSLSVVDEPPNVHIITKFSGNTLHDCIDDYNPILAPGEIGLQVIGDDTAVRFSEIYAFEP